MKQNDVIFLKKTDFLFWNCFDRFIDDDIWLN